MSPASKVALKDIAFWLFGALVGVLGYFAVELRGEVKANDRALTAAVLIQSVRDGTQDSTLGALEGDIKHIKKAVDEIRGILKDE